MFTSSVAALYNTLGSTITRSSPLTGVISVPLACTGELGNHGVCPHTHEEAIRDLGMIQDGVYAASPVGGRGLATDAAPHLGAFIVQMVKCRE